MDAVPPRPTVLLIAGLILGSEIEMFNTKFKPKMLFLFFSHKSNTKQCYLFHINKLLLGDWFTIQKYFYVRV